MFMLLVDDDLDSARIRCCGLMIPAQGLQLRSQAAHGAHTRPAVLAKGQA